MAKRTVKPRLSVAGPGAGKTHTMVEEILNVLPALPPHQFLAAITFTNAAAHTIRERLQHLARIRDNVFIGTTHTFVSRFVLTPCATLFGRLPEDRVFTDVDVHQKGRGAANYARNLINKGVVPFDSMFPIARDLLQDKTVRTRLGCRIAHLFVDEFQDTDIKMLEILDQLRKCGQTHLHAVGDPEQFVMGFTYRGTSIPVFEKLPFFRFKKRADSTPLLDNHRSNGEIVDFANRFRSDLQQRPIKPHRHQSRVLFICECELRSIVATFQHLSQNVECYDGSRVRLYLSAENATFESVMQEFGLKATSNRGRKARSLLGDALELIATALDRSPRRACDDFRLTRLQWRSTGTTLLKMAKAAEFSVQQFVTFISTTFSHKVSDSRKRLLEDELTSLKTHLSLRDGQTTHQEHCASIRRAKGLEADAVLALAMGLAELKKWLTTNQSVRAADKQDTCRLGYVAFTRAREMLCIACLKPTDAEAEALISDLGIQCVTGGMDSRSQA